MRFTDLSERTRSGSKESKPRNDINPPTRRHTQIYILAYKICLPSILLSGDIEGGCGNVLVVFQDYGLKKKNRATH